MARYIILNSTIVLLHLITGCIKQENRFETISTDFKELYTLGENPSDSSNFLVNPLYIETDSRQNVYVADDVKMEVLVYSQEGKFLRKFGSRGRGPGEFISIRGFSVIDTTAYVFDQSLQRVNIFSYLGDYKNSYTLKDITAAVKIFNHRDLYLLFYLENRPSVDNSYFGHVYDKEFQKNH